MSGLFIGRGSMLRGLAIAVALLLGLTTNLSSTSAASQSEAIVPPGTVDAAARAIANLDDQAATAYSFNVYTFETGDDAQSAADLEEQLLIRAASAGPNEVLGTPVAGDITEDTVSDELLGSVDSAVSYTTTVEIGDTSSLVISMVIRQDTNVYLWTAIGSGSTGTPVATLATDAPVLEDLAVDWFAEDHTGGALIDTLPTVDLFPEGYTEFLTAENIDELAPDAVIDSLSTPAATPAP